MLSYDSNAAAAVTNQTGTNLTITPSTTVYESIRGGCHTLAPGVEPIQAIIYETILTFTLVLTVLLVAVEKSSNQRLAPLAIGFAVLANIAAA